MSEEQASPTEVHSQPPEGEPALPPPSSSSSSTVDLSELKTILAGLPESIANAVKEAIPAPPKQTPVKREAPAKKETPAPAMESAPAAPQKKTLRDWWFS